MFKSHHELKTTQEQSLTKRFIRPLKTKEGSNALSDAPTPHLNAYGDSCEISRLLQKMYFHWFLTFETLKSQSRTE